IGSTTDLRVSLQLVLNSITRLLKTDAACILLYNSAALNLEYAGGAGFRSDITHSVVGLGEDLAGRVALTRQPIEVMDFAAMELPAPFRRIIKDEGFTSYRCLPLIAKGEPSQLFEPVYFMS
nr:GAF domain-containing protein [Nitrospiraceae bacterium]